MQNRKEYTAKELLDRGSIRRLQPDEIIQSGDLFYVTDTCISVYDKGTLIGTTVANNQIYRFTDSESDDPWEDMVYREAFGD